MSPLLVTVALAASSLPPQSVTLRASDGQTVYGTYHRAAPGAPLVLLFHQASSSSGEYERIVPRLVQAGFACLTIDQRSGGFLFGENKTATDYTMRTGKTASFRDALPDLNAALDWGKGKAKKVFALGSSYSGGLVFELAARRPNDLAGILAFSPLVTSEALAAAAKLRLPVFATSAEDEVANTKVLFDAVLSPQKTQFVPSKGPHGASALAVRDRAVSEPYWQALLAFLRQYR